MRQQKQGQKRTKDAQTTADEKRVLTRSRGVGGVGLDDGEEVGSYESADFAHGSGDAVVLAADGGCRGFRGHEADVVAGA